MSYVPASQLDGIGICHVGCQSTSGNVPCVGEWGLYPVLEYFGDYLLRAKINHDYTECPISRRRGIKVCGCGCGCLWLCRNCYCRAARSRVPRVNQVGIYFRRVTRHPTLRHVPASHMRLSS